MDRGSVVTLIDQTRADLRAMAEELETPEIGETVPLLAAAYGIDMDELEADGADAVLTVLEASPSIPASLMACYVSGVLFGLAYARAMERADA